MSETRSTPNPSSIAPLTAWAQPLIYPAVFLQTYKRDDDKIENILSSRHDLEPGGGLVSEGWSASYDMLCKIGRLAMLGLRPRIASIIVNKDMRIMCHANKIPLARDPWHFLARRNHVQHRL